MFESLFSALSTGCLSYDGGETRQMAAVCVCVSDLCDTMVLQVDDSRHGHLHAAKHSNHLQLLVIKRWSTEVLHQRDEESLSHSTESTQRSERYSGT